MLYQRPSFTVPATGSSVTQDEFDRIFGKQEKRYGKYAEELAKKEAEKEKEKEDAR